MNPMLDRDPSSVPTPTTDDLTIDMFIPSFPQIEDSNFNEQVYNQKELRDYILTGKSKARPKHGERLNQQVIIARFMSSLTFHDELLLFHYPGVGKTCTSVNVVETVTSTNIYGSIPIRKALVLVSSSDLIKTFRKQLIEVCTDGQYMANVDDVQMGGKRDVQYARSKKLTSSKYIITTHESFAKDVLRKTHPDRVRERYSNMIIIIDEVHTLTRGVYYQDYYDFLQNLSNRKILLMSGTPMTDSVDDIIPIMNMILPKDKQVDVREFSKKSDNHEYIKQIVSHNFKGRISYLKATTNVEYSFITNVHNKQYSLYETKMSEFQSRVYDAMYDPDSEDNNLQNFRRQEREASLFVFPDESIGMHGFNQYVDQNASKTFRTHMFDHVKYETTENKLKFIEKYSCKYAAVIRDILENPKKNFFIYVEFIQGSGAIILALCLELFGFARAKGFPTSKYKRYSILSETGNTGTNIDKVISRYNTRDNCEGEYIQVLIGGKKMSIGYSLKNVQRIHIITPHWNFALIDQTIRRGIRMFSHANLDAGTPVRVFLHSAVSVQNKSIDEFMYKTCYDKDIKIKTMEYYIKLYAFDCPFNYEINRLKPRRSVEEKAELEVVYGNRNFSRECEFQSCYYKCEDIKEMPDVLSLDTYQIYYSDHIIKNIINCIRKLFKIQSVIPIHELFDHLNGQNYTPLNVLQTLYIIIETPLRMMDRYGSIAYLNEYNNIYYLTSSISNNSTFMSTFYVDNPIVKRDVGFEAVSSEYFQGNFVQYRLQVLIDSIRNKDPAALRQLNTIDSVIQEAFLENAIASKENYITTEIIKMFEIYLVREGNIIYSTLLEKQYEVIRKFEHNRWSNSEDTETKEIRVQQATIAEKEIYGIMVGGKFKIITPKNKRGKVCGSYTVSELEGLLKQLNVWTEEDKKTTRNARCEKLYNVMRERNLIRIK